MLTVFHSSIIQKFFMASVIAFLLGIGLSSLHAAEPNLEKIWDHELKRWLTPDELGTFGDLFHRRMKPPRSCFPIPKRFVKETLTLTAEKKALIATTHWMEIPRK